VGGNAGTPFSFFSDVFLGHFTKILVRRWLTISAAFKFTIIINALKYFYCIFAHILSMLETWKIQVRFCLRASDIHFFRITPLGNCAINSVDVMVYCVGLTFETSCFLIGITEPPMMPAIVIHGILVQSVCSSAKVIGRSEMPFST